MTSQARGPESSAPTWRPERPWKRSASLRPTDLFGGSALTPAASMTLYSTLDLCPCSGPVVVVLACVAAVIAAVRQWHLPVVGVLPEVRIRCVVLVAELRIRRQAVGLGRRRERRRIARLALGRSLTEVLSDLGIGIRRDDEIHPLVHAVRMSRVLRDHPGVGPSGRALRRLEPSVGPRCLHRLLVSQQREVLVLPGGADHVVAIGERVDLLGGIRPVLADIGVLLLE